MNIEELPFLETDEYLLPEGEMTISVESEERFQAVKDSVAVYENKLIAGKRGGVEGAPFVGVLARITNVHNKKTGSFSVTLTGYVPVMILSCEKTDCRDGGVVYKASYMENETFCGDLDKFSSLIRLANRTISKIVNLNPDFHATHIKQTGKNWKNALNEAYKIASETEYCDREYMLAKSDCVEIMEELCRGLDAELEMENLDKSINDKVSEAMIDHQRESFLRTQLKVISDELGDSDQEEAEKLYDKVTALKVSPTIKEKLINDVNKLGKLSTASSDYFVIESYLEYVLSLPWGVYDEEHIDIEKAGKILDRDHYGMKDVKERILEFIAVRKLARNNNGSIICLVGAPGVGKTSIVKSIAQALNKKYVRMSLGGIRDEAEIRGHRRTYIGAMAGRIMNGIKESKSANPVFLLDEIDKLTADTRGDPASALLEALDPAQNNAFTDHYVDLPFDLSKTLFITTANTVDTIPKPLLDRMEVIEMDGYTLLEKTEIASRHLIKKVCAENGIEKGLKISKPTIEKIITQYTRESGVRELNRKLEKIARKVAKEVVETADTSPRKIGENDLEKYLGVPTYLEDEKNKTDQVGVVTGLAWTPVGGCILNVEVSVFKGKGDIILTGQLGDVMKESARIAVSLLRERSDKYGLSVQDFSENDIHIHVPEGAVKKDGPSAGVTLAAATLSALTNKKASCNVCMTGEISLKGNVLPIGGLREKLLAALRAGFKNVLVPTDNEKDVKEIPEEITSALDITYVKDVDSVFQRTIL